MSPSLPQEQDMPIAQLLAMYGGYPPEEGEGDLEDQANGEGEANQAENENENSNEADIENEEAENEGEEPEEPEIISSRSSTSEENINNHEKVCKYKLNVKTRPYRSYRP